MTGETLESLGTAQIVLGDANVLYFRVLRDYLVYVADEGAVSIRWSRVILNEVVTHLVANFPTFSLEQGDPLVRLLNDAYPDAEVEPSASALRRVKLLALPDEDDRHVLAAAIAAKADILCTNNTKDFPPDAMASVGIELLTADGLLVRPVAAYPSTMLAAHRRAVASLTGATDDSTLAALRRAGAPRTADLMETLLSGA